MRTHRLQTRVIGQTYCATHTAEQRAASTWGRGSTRRSRATRAVVLHLWPHCYLAYDGCTTTSTEDDHVTPVSRGGTDNLTNRRGACHHCHRIKSTREAAEARRTAPPKTTHPTTQHTR